MSETICLTRRGDAGVIRGGLARAGGENMIIALFVFGLLIGCVCLLLLFAENKTGVHELAWVLGCAVSATIMVAAILLGRG